MTRDVSKAVGTLIVFGYLLSTPALAAERAPLATSPAQSDADPIGRTCGTPDPTPQELVNARVAMKRWSEERGIQSVGGTIQVAFHVITSGGEGHVTDQQIEEQIRVLNSDFASTGYRFQLASVDRTDHVSWFKMTPRTGKETHAKRSLAVDPAHRLNIYTCGPGLHLLGWAYLPFAGPEEHYLHGVVVHYGSMPGGFLSRYNLGATVVHEVGHYLGLLHTFQGGCTEPGDFVDDTPAEAVPAFGCPIGRNTCPSPGDDPIHNYMDYGDDACLTEFTPGQDALMDAIVPVYRPSLLDAAVAREIARPEIGPDAASPGDMTRAIEFRGAYPNPFRSETAIRFMLPSSDRVSLRVYNLAGQLVRTLIDAPLPPGAHSAMFSAKDLPSGMYYLSLRVGRAQMSRSVILVR